MLQPWRALKRRWVLFMTYTRPLRRTTRQSRCRFLSERSEFLTFIGRLPISRRGVRLVVADTPELRSSELMVGDTGIEPVTPSMSTKCSTAELIAPSTG